MNKTALYLTKKQIAGTIVTFAELAKGTRMNQEAAMNDLLNAVVGEEIAVAYTGGELTKDSHLMLTAASDELLKAAKGEPYMLALPKITTSMTQDGGDLAAQIYNLYLDTNYDWEVERGSEAETWLSQLIDAYKAYAEAGKSDRRFTMLDPYAGSDEPEEIDEDAWQPPADNGLEDEDLALTETHDPNDASLTEAFGECMMCGKPLTVPASVQRGIGPTCWSKLSHVFGVSVGDLMDKSITSDEKLDTYVGEFKAMSTTRKYETLEEAVAAEGHELIPVSEIDKLVREAGIPVSRMVKAFGGDGGREPALSPEWEYVLVGSRRRYLNAWTATPEALEALRSMKAERKGKKPKVKADPHLGDEPEEMEDDGTLDGYVTDYGVTTAPATETDEDEDYEDYEEEDESDNEE